MNATNFTQIGSVISKGNSSQVQEYSYEDFNLQTGKMYYRLKQVDKDAKFTYSQIASIEIGMSATIKLSPNPVNSVIKVEGLNASVNTTLTIYNASGKVLQHETSTGTSIYTRNIQRLPSGTYYLKVQSNLNITTLKFIKE